MDEKNNSIYTEWRTPPCLSLLKNSAQQYAWGDTKGIIPFVEAELRPGYPIGEVWMGSHERAPSKIILDDSEFALDTLIKQDSAHWLGDHISKKYNELPFLFKVLAAASPLSLQVHPNLEQAKIGFAKEESAGIGRLAPERTFKDPHHKPELAVALTSFQAMAGFRSIYEICSLLGHSLCDSLEFKGKDKSELRSLIKRLFCVRGEEYLALETELHARAEQLLHSEQKTARDAAHWVLELQSRYPGDPGQFAPLFLDLLQLEPGQGLFVPAGVIHSYLKGSILEIMACSDNVIRAGLTVKHIDVDLLCNIVDLETKPLLILPEYQRFDWGTHVIYKTPAKEFRLESIEINSSASSSSITITSGGPKIFLCTKGSFRLHNGEQLELPARKSCFAAGSCGQLELKGEGKLWIAAVGEIDT